MVPFLTTLLIISIMGLVGLIAIKRWELSHDRLVMSGVRPVAGHYLGSALTFIEEGLPMFVRRSLRVAYAIVRSLTHRLVAWTMLHTERWLEKTLRALRGATQARPEGEASEFLREVAAHKRSLLRKSAKTRAIYEE